MAWMAAAKNTVTVSVVTDVATATRGGSGPRSTSCVVVASGRPAPMKPLHQRTRGAQRLAHGAPRANVAVLAAVTGVDDGVVGVD